MATAIGKDAMASLVPDVMQAALKVCMCTLPVSAVGHSTASLVAGVMQAALKVYSSPFLVSCVTQRMLGRLQQSCLSPAYARY